MIKHVSKTCASVESQKKHINTYLDPSVSSSSSKSSSNISYKTSVSLSSPLVLGNACTSALSTRLLFYLKKNINNYILSFRMNYFEHTRRGNFSTISLIL